MKKLVEDVVAQEKNNRNTKKSKQTPGQKNYSEERETMRNSRTSEATNRELEEVLAGLTTTIKVVGCGGAGTNTITRCLEGNISGSDLVAINTDAQHLLESYALKPSSPCKASVNIE